MLLHGASGAGRVEIVKFLITRGCDINAKTTCGTTPLVSAICGKNYGVAKYLIAYGADVNATCDYGDPVIHYAINPHTVNEETEIIKTLVAHGANINAKSEGMYKGSTPLHNAIRISKNLNGTVKNPCPAWS